MYRFRHSIQSFAKDESGVLLAEFLLLLPMMIWGFLALFVYWDVYRTINISQKAAYAIADLLSRQVVVTTTFIDGLQEVLAFLTPGAQASRMRITSFEMDEGTVVRAAWDSDDRYVLLFSRSPGGAVVAYNQMTIQDLQPFIPEMDDLDSVVIVETWVDYSPDFDIGVLAYGPGLQDQSFSQFIVTRPRTRRVCLDGTSGCA
ncbi:hypothetical protein MCELHM10_00751 [Paracoccaceae bacterium]